MGPARTQDLGGGTADADELVALARVALSHYDIAASAIRPIRLINNAVFEVTEERGTRLVLRIHRPAYRTAAHIRSELQCLEMLTQELRDTPVDVPRPIASRSGDLFVDVRRPNDAGEADSGSRYCDLLTWLDGRELKPTRGLGPRSSFLLGEGLARLHDAAQRFDCPPGFDLPRWDGKTMFSPTSPFQSGPMDDFLSAEALSLFEQVADRTRATFEQLDRTPEAWGIIHKDFILINCRFTRRFGAWRLGILDFDDLGWGYFLYDLAPLLGNLADFPDSYPRLSGAFLDGYRSVRSLPRSLETHLPILMAARHAVTLTWLAGMHRRGETDLPIKSHVEYRVGEMRRFLAVA